MFGHAELVFAAPLLLLLLILSYTDLRGHRLPNVLTLGGALLGLALHGVMQGASGALLSAGGLAVGLALLLPFYLAGGMAAGDVKMMGMAGAFLGLPTVLLAAGLSLIAGGVAAVAILVLRRGALAALRRYGLTAKCLLLTGRWIYVPPAAGEAANTRFPYALAIALGTVGALRW